MRGLAVLFSLSLIRKGLSPDQIFHKVFPVVERWLSIDRAQAVFQLSKGLLKATKLLQLPFDVWHQILTCGQAQCRTISLGKMQLICLMTGAEIKNNDSDETRFQFRSCRHRGNENSSMQVFRGDYDTEIAHKCMTRTRCNEMPLLKKKKKKIP